MKQCGLCSVGQTDYETKLAQIKQNRPMGEVGGNRDEVLNIA